MSRGEYHRRARTRTCTERAKYTDPVRLTPDEVQFLGRKIVKTLVREGKLEIDSETRVVEAIMKVITDDLMVEDRLNEAVREVLVQHANEMQRSNITYTEMFKMVKKKLAKEKGIIL
jgi:uncharacterized protein